MNKKVQWMAKVRHNENSQWIDLVDDQKEAETASSAYEIVRKCDRLGYTRKNRWILMTLYETENNEIMFSNYS